MPDAETAGAPLQVLRDQIISAETSGDLAWFATSDAAGLTDVLHREAIGPDLTGPADAFLVLGTAYWCRFLACGGADEETLAAAVYFLLPVYVASPGHVPDALHPVLEVLRGGAGDTDSALLVGAAGVGLVAFHQRHRYPLLLRGAETLLRHALVAIPAGDPLHGFCQSSLGVVLHHIAAEEAAPALLTEAVELCRAAVAAPVDDAAERARRLGNLGRTLISRGADAADVTEGADATRRALAVTTDGTPYHTVLIANLADALLRQATSSGDPSLLTDAVALYRQALAVMSEGDPERVERTFALGVALITSATAPAGSENEPERRARLYAEGAAAVESAIAIAPAEADRIRFTATLAYARHGWGELTADEDVLRQAETEARRVSDALPQAHPLHAQALYVRGDIHAARFDLWGDQRQQDEAIAAARQAAELTPPGSPQHAARVAGLCAKLRVRARQADDDAAAAEAASLARAALREAAPGSADRARLLFELGVALQVAAALRPDAGPDREGLDCLRECLDLPAPSDQFGARVRWELGRALAGTPGAPDDDWRRGIGLVREAIALLPPASPSRADYLSSLAHLLLRRAETVGGEPRSVEPRSVEPQSAETLFAEAADLSRQAAAAATPGTAQEAACRSNLGAVLVTSGRYAGDAELLAEAVRSHRAAVASTRLADYHRPMRLGNLGDALRTLAEQTSDAALIAEAIEVGHEALGQAPPGHPLRRQCLIQLGMCLRARSEFDDDPAPLAEAARCLREAAELAQEAGQPAFAARHTLANVLADVGAYSGDAGPREEAIGLLRAELAGDDGGPGSGGITPAERAMLLHSLGWATSRQAADRNDDTRQEDSIGMLREAAALLPERHIGRTAILMSLGAALLERSESAAEPAWALEAVDVLRAALAECPERGSRRGGVLSNLSVALRHAYDATDDRRYLEESAERAAEAESLGFGRGQSRAYGRLNLAVAQHLEAAARADPGALANAAATMEDALAELPASHPLRPRYLVNLAALHWTRTELAGDPLSLLAGGPSGARRAPEAAASLRRAAEAAREALASLPGEHPDRARAEWVLAQAQLRRVQYGEQADLAEVTRLARSAAESPSAPVETRLRAARVLGEASAVRGQDADALEGYAYAVGLLARAAPRSLTRAAQEDRLGFTYGLASDAAAMALRAGDAGRALTLLEQGRGILLSQALDLRGDLSRLRARDPALAREFERLRDALGADTETAAALLTPGAGAAGTVPASSRAARLADARHAMARRWDPLIEQIRDLDEDMAGFLRPPDVPELRAAAARGPVVVVNVSRYRSDAILVTPRGTDVVELPQLAPRAVLSRALSFGPLVDMAYGARGQDLIPGAVDGIAGVLEWLWDTVCDRVLDRLGFRYTPDDGEPWPRVYWCPTGWLSFLPLHAARRRSGAGKSVLDRVVSSYTPTLRALLRARAQLESYPEPAALPDPLVVSLPRTPGGAVLAGAEAEADALARLFPGRTRELAGEAATVAAVRDALPAHSWVHFGCHGVTDPEHPSAAGLQLHDGRLRALDAAALPLREPVLAMLAACSTSQGGTTIPDEAIHVASSFQLAGYPHVIGTLWPVSDRFSARLTEKFYAALAADIAAGRPADPAVALHSAVRALRAGGLAAAPHLWAAHMHIGP